MHRIVIIEDDELVANIYRNKFLVENFLVETAHDGESGLEVISRTKPDVVLLDLMLPKMSGVELMKAIRAQPEFSKLPLVVFSNTFLTNLIRDAWNAGANKCLSKANCTPKQVVEAVRNAIASAGATAAAPASPAAAGGPASKTTSVEARDHASDEARLQEELRRSFSGRLPSLRAGLRNLLQASTKQENQSLRMNLIRDLYGHVHSLTGAAAAANLTLVAHVAEALEALLKDLHEKPKHVTKSPLRTVASAIDLLALLLIRSDQTPVSDQPPRILIVDDEPISRRAIAHALERTKLTAEALDDPAAAYNLLSTNRFDLIFLDVDMPGMSGFELCTKLRALPMHKETPVVFVTSLDDFESRANSSVSGGTDFITKPFLFIELGLKALAYILRGRLANPPSASPDA